MSLSNSSYESDRNYEKKKNQALYLYHKYKNGEKLNIGQLHKILKYSNKIFNHKELYDKGHKIMIQNSKINKLQKQIKDLKKDNKKITNPKKNLEELEIIQFNIQFNRQKENYLESIEIIKFKDKIIKEKEKRISKLEINAGIKDTIIQNLTNYKNILDRQLTRHDLESLSWKNGCHKVIKLLQDIERLNSNDTVLELCSHREYIDFPEEITIKSMIEAGVGYNPEDSFNPLDYQ